ncbi:MAG: DUF6105 family protein [Pseudomonadota bacterium]
MRTLLILWLLPLVLFAAWFGLSAYDISFGTKLLARETHDQVFAIYSSVLGIEKEAMPALFAKALAFDVGLIGLVVAYRKRGKILPHLSFANR